MYDDTRLIKSNQAFCAKMRLLISLDTTNTICYTVTMTTTPPNYIYESDDGGLTIYRRRFGDPFREVVRRVPPDLTQRSRLWVDHILPAAQDDPILDDMIGKVEMHHALKT